MLFRLSGIVWRAFPSFILTGLLAAVWLGTSAGIALRPVSASVSPQYVFCSRLVAFGHAPGYGRLVRLHNAAMRLSYLDNAQAEQNDYLKYEAALIGHRVLTALRAQVYRDCGLRP